MARSASYEGRVPAAKGTGPRNLPKTASDATSQVRKPGVKPSAASTPRIKPGLAGPGNKIPAGGGAGIPKATTPLAGKPSRVINKPKTGSPKRGKGSPRADFPSKI